MLAWDVRRPTKVDLCAVSGAITVRRTTVLRADHCEPAHSPPHTRLYAGSPWLTDSQHEGLRRVCVCTAYRHTVSPSLTVADGCPYARIVGYFGKRERKARQQRSRFRRAVKHGRVVPIEQFSPEHPSPRARERGFYVAAAFILYPRGTKRRGRLETAVAHVGGTFANPACTRVEIQTNRPLSLDEAHAALDANGLGWGVPTI